MKRGRREGMEAGGSRLFVEKIGTQETRAGEGLLVLPVVYPGLVTREEHVGHTPSVIFGRTGIYGGARRLS